MVYLNNPGAGNCGYYAFSIGIIAIIKEELAHGNSQLLERLNEALHPQRFDAQNFLEFDLLAYQKNYSSYKKDFLDTMQARLREIAVNFYIDNIEIAFEEEKARHDEAPLTLVDSTETFTNFMNIVYAQQSGDPARAQKDYNELAHSDGVKELAKKVVAEYKRSPNQQDKELVRIAKTHFLRDVFDKGDQLNQGSVILAGIRKINDDGYWATEKHLSQIATRIEVNLNIQDRNCGRNEPGKPTVILRNQSNIHWTTRVDSIPEPSIKPIKHPKTSFTKTTEEALTDKVASKRTVAEDAVLKATLDPILAVCKQKNIKGDWILGVYEELIKNSQNDAYFKISDKDSDDEKLAKQLQEEELINVGLRPRKQ